uniref:HCO3_cotransp domain-containing protein n=1 Tax=Steinernema glaseri TaxID=37863 RepID=A0A1I7Z095_9BILA
MSWLLQRPFKDLVEPYHVHNDFSVVVFLSSALIGTFVVSPLAFVFVVKNFVMSWLLQRPFKDLVEPYHVHNDFSVVVFLSSALIGTFVVSPLAFVFVVKKWFQQDVGHETSRTPHTLRNRPVAEHTDIEESSDSSRETHSEATLIEFDAIDTEMPNSIDSTQDSS